MLAKLVVSLCSYLLCCSGLLVVIKLPLLSFTHQLEPNTGDPDTSLEFNMRKTQLREKVSKTQRTSCYNISVARGG